MGSPPKLPVSTARASAGAAALVLPGMSLNETVFPDLGEPVIAADFNEFDGRGGADEGMGDEEIVGGRGWGAVMQAYVDAADRLTHTPVWTEATHRIVVGHSFGGMLALAWLLDRRPAVNGALLVATTAGPMYGVARLRLPGGPRVPLAPLMRLWDSALVTRVMKWMTGGDARHEIDFRAYEGRSDLAIGLAGWRATSAGAKRSYRAAMRGFDVRHRLAEITVPVTVLHGSRDVYFDGGAARTLASGLARGTLRVVEGARHVLPLSHAGAVRRAVRDLIVR